MGDLTRQDEVILFIVEAFEDNTPALPHFHGESNVLLKDHGRKIIAELRAQGKEPTIREVVEATVRLVATGRMMFEVTPVGKGTELTQ